MANLLNTQASSAILTQQRAEKTNCIGIFGGTFDPIHHGHTQPLTQAAKLLSLKQIRLLPAHIPPHKNTTIANSEQRVAMVSLICQENPLFILDCRELQRSEKSYTVTTLQEIQQESPNAKLYFFIGMDSLLNFTQWHQWQTILTLCQLIVMPRPGYNSSDIPAPLQPLCKILQVNDTNTANAQIILMPECLVDISSSEIRRKIARQETVSPWLSNKVESFIKKYQLYHDTSV